METNVRCFRRVDKSTLRRAMWIMTGETRGAFIRGDYNSIDGPRWSVQELSAGGPDGMPIEEITPEDAIEEVSNWPEAGNFLRKAFARHPKISLDELQFSDLPQIVYSVARSTRHSSLGKLVRMWIYSDVRTAEDADWAYERRYDFESCE